MEILIVAVQVKFHGVERRNRESQGPQGYISLLQAVKAHFDYTAKWLIQY